MFEFTPTPRVKRSPFYDATVRDGVKSFYPYNNMFLPTGYGDPEKEYWRLINGVSMWDVGVQRQVELFGEDALKLAQILSPRDLSNLEIGQSKISSKELIDIIDKSDRAFAGPSVPAHGLFLTKVVYPENIFVL